MSGAGFGGSGGWADMSEAVWEGGTQSEVADGVGTAAFSYDTENTLVVGNIASWSNATNEAMILDAQGKLSLLRPGWPTHKLTAGWDSNRPYIGTESASSDLHFRPRGTLVAKVSSGAHSQGTDYAYITLTDQSIHFERAKDALISVSGTNTDYPSGSLLIAGPTVWKDAVTHIKGGDLTLAGGDGSLNSVDVAHGGDVILAGGTGYGTGNNGHIKLPNIPITDPGETGTIWNDAGTLKVSL